MDKNLHILEEMLFKTMFSEIEERYNDVIDIYRNDQEILSIANHLRKLTNVVGEVYREIPNPGKKLTEELYTVLYQILKEVSSILYDLSIAEGEQLDYVIAEANRKFDNIISLLQKLS